MKPAILFLSLKPLLASAWLLSILSAPAGEPPPAQADLGYDVVNGKTNRIGRIHSVTRSAVYVIYEGDLGGRNIPRQELPSELKARFPYEPAAVQEYQKQQAETLIAQHAAASTASRGVLRQREQAALNEIQILVDQDVALQKEVNILKRLPAGNGRRVKLAHVCAQQENIRMRISNLRGEVERLQARRSLIP